MSWRESAAPIIAKVLQDTKDLPEAEARKVMRDAYPWGKRRYWPYKIWCDEIRRQTGKKKKKRSQEQKNQTDLFHG